MPKISYRANLSAATFPLTVGEGGRTVIVPGPDNNFDRRVDPTGEQKNAGIPQALYMENVLPTANGYQSIGLLDPGVDIDRPLIEDGVYLVQVVELKGIVASSGRIVSGALYIYRLRVAPFTGYFRCGATGASTPTIVGTTLQPLGRYSVAVVRGVAYLTDSYNLYTVEADDTFSTVTITNISATLTPAGFFSSANINYIVSSNNYLIALSNGVIYHSSTTTSTDFDASLVSGAGQSIPTELEGLILGASATLNGFYVFSQKRTLFCEYTGNARYPWKIHPVQGSSGADLIFGRQWSGDSSSAGHVVIEKTNQIRLLQRNQATAVGSEVTEYLTGVKARDSFNQTTDTFSLESGELQVPSIYYYANRYILVSCDGQLLPLETVSIDRTQYSTLLIYDTLLQRYGRFKIPHGYIIQVDTAALGELPGRLAFVDLIGSRVYLLSLDVYGTEEIPSGYTALPHEAVLILGKFQYVRSRMMQLHEVEAEGPQHTDIITSPNFSCVALPSLDGRNFDSAVSPTSEVIDGGLATYKFHHTAKNHSIVFKGAFNLSSVQMEFSTRGDR